MAQNLKAKIYRHAERGVWIVLIRDTVYDDAKLRKYVATKDCDTLAEAEAFAIAKTGTPAKISL
jgi:hypothetical protein